MNYHASWKIQIESYKRNDPATQKQCTVLVAVPNLVFLATRKTPDHQAHATGELVLLAFYFSLQVYWAVANIDFQTTRCQIICR